MKHKSGEIQYLADTLLIEELCALEFGLTKQASVLSMLGGIAGSIKDQVKQQVNTDSPEGAVGGVLNLMAPAVLFRLHPIIGILYLIGTSFGLDITSIFNKIMSLLKPKLEKGISLSPEEVNSIGKSVVAAEVGPISAAASGFSDDMLEHLRTIKVSDLRVKNAQDISSFLSSLTGYEKTKNQTLPNKIPWLVGESGASPIQKIFGDLFASRSTGKAKWLLGGFIIWIIKTVLAGAGLLAVTGAVSRVLNPTSNTSNKVNTSVQTNVNNESSAENVSPETSVNNLAETTSTALTQASNGLKPSGRGEQIFPNDETHLWVVPIINGSIVSTLLTWVVDIYPELESKQQEVLQTHAFQKVVNILQKNYHSSSPNSVTVPKPFTSRKQIVDLVVPELSTSNQ